MVLLAEVVAALAGLGADVAEVAATMAVLRPPVESGITVNCTDRADVICGNKEDATETPAEIKEDTSSCRANMPAMKGGTIMMRKYPGRLMMARVAVRNINI